MNDPNTDKNLAFETLPNGHVRLTWDGIAGAGPQGQASAGRIHADFDPCPYRKLSAMESAQAWARTVLGWRG